ncbi:hypothetical protein M406DRAFT_107147 [Cryphonectria parasitica EP155]|uniref:Zn(2)-C6 fungal-type domain-containing protein n=1 Tax=Cryphonectria parasitica (strain ATCC 38755 / EP155) TaxID=660469 RepID=A0A9P4Y0J0_CRYP1|nr:uncharacterized protein M406DRAFT_107147 [Cryphonectria parasitica EP155]KAF3764752.1 hypothetical protein M406DRAFT_107147 [Cryphonectria parasitica EP155]
MSNTNTRMYPIVPALQRRIYTGQGERIWIPRHVTYTKTRAACDRCHSQKLRCPKQAGSIVCARCLKAGTPCTYSPPGTSVLLPRAATGIISLEEDAMCEAGEGQVSSPFAGAFDWGSTAANFDFNNFFSAVTPPSVAQQDPALVQPSTASRPPTTHLGSTKDVSFDEPASTRSTCLRKLTGLLAEAESLSARLPFRPSLHISKNDLQEASLKVLAEKMSTKSLLEDFFVVAQQLVDVYPAAVSAATTPDPQSGAAAAAAAAAAACTQPDCTHTVELPPAAREIEQHLYPSTADMALANLLFACHTRLLDILDGMFQLMTSCVRVTIASRREPDFDVSEMRVGSFVPQRTAAVLMQIALMRHLVARLTDRLGAFGERIASWAGGGAAEASLEGDILRMQHELLAKRQSKNTAQVGLIEEFLLKMDFLGD